VARWRYAIQEFRRLPLREFVGKGRSAIGRRGLLEYKRIRSRFRPPGVSDKQVTALLGAGDRKEAGIALRNRSDRPFFIGAEGRAEIASRFREFFPDAQQDLITRAKRHLEHETDLLGSGPTKLGERIDWYRDFKSGYVFPAVHYTRIARTVYRLPRGADVKVPLELSRFNHVIELGQAYWLSGNEAFAGEIRDQILSWIDANPPEIGCNWMLAMEAAIRAANWTWAYAFIRYSPACDDEFHFRFVKSMLEHGRFIRSNLERRTGFVGNHYVSDLLGLAYISLAFPELPGADAWRDFALKELEREVLVQNRPDGVNFEASVGYHRLAVELFLYPYMLFRMHGIEPSGQYRDRLESMIEYVHHYTPPSGIAPTIGDGDDGRVHVCAPLPVNDHRYLLAVGAEIFDRPEWRQRDPEVNRFAFWMLGGNWSPVDPLPSSIKSRAFPDGGVYVMRKGDIHLVVDAGDVGQNGKGGHAHNDTLSVVLSVGDRRVLIDPGTYCYTPYPDMRDRFRSTRMHNTVMIDDQEHNRLVAGEPFILREDARPRVERWEDRESVVVFEGSHNGYSRLSEPVEHRRAVTLDKDADLVLIRDRISGKGTHRFEQNFHFENVELKPMEGAGFIPMILEGSYYAKSLFAEFTDSVREDLSYFVDYPDFRVCVVVLSGGNTRASVEDSQYSETYGSLAPGRVLRLYGNFTDSADLLVVFLIER